jgi:spermidine synthase
VKPWEVLGRTRTPDGTELALIRHPSEYLILANGQSLMSSRMHRSEDALAVLGCHRARTLTRPHVLVGGLGMGFTLRAALDILPPGARIVVAELVPAVLEWNHGPLGALAKHPLDDPRVRIQEGDVGATMRSSPGRFDAVLLDVDNGPAALTASSNAGLYDSEGVAVVRASLKPGGVLAVWSAKNDRRFEQRLRAGGFSVQTDRASSRLKKRLRHTVLVAHNQSTSARQVAFAIAGTSRPTGKTSDQVRAGAPARSLPASIVRNSASMSTGLTK